MLQSPSVKTWLGGVEPAWTLLEQASFFALHTPPSPTSGPIRLASDLAPEEFQQSAVTRNTLILLLAAADVPGLKLTANQARRLQSDIKILYTSGYAKSAAANIGPLDPAATVVNKPFRRAQLLEKVRAVLDGG